MMRSLAAVCAVVVFGGCSFTADTETSGGGKGGSGSGSGGGSSKPQPPPNAEWREANLTTFTSYPAPGSEECEEFNGCMWAGYFEFVEGQQTESWVMQHDIVAVHSRDASTYALKTLRLRQDSHELDVTVYDVCSDSDCDGCCTRNASETGFLLDLESYTSERFGSSDGVVEWTCLDCE